MHGSKAEADLLKNRVTNQARNWIEKTQKVTVHWDPKKKIFVNNYENLSR